MNKILVVIVSILLLVAISYSYYENTKTEVFLTGKVVVFDVENISQNVNNNEDIIYVSSKSIGTLTFVKPNGEFAALGHSISDINFSVEGECYEAKFNSIKKSTQNNPGTIVAGIRERSKIGDVSNQSYCGVFGTVDKISSHDSIKIETANRYTVEKGQAYLLINFDGKGIEEYEVEITRVNFLSRTKNITITVKSPELLAKTGGIVQGMSGTPIVQNGRLIGAINCVNVYNPTEAYGIFVDKLL